MKKIDEECAAFKAYSDINRQQILKYKMTDNLNKIYHNY